MKMKEGGNYKYPSCLISRMNVSRPFSLIDAKTVLTKVVAISNSAATLCFLLRTTRSTAFTPLPLFPSFNKFTSSFSFSFIY